MQGAALQYLLEEVFQYQRGNQPVAGMADI